MERQRYTIATDVKSDAYRKLIKCAQSSCSEFILVVRPSMPFAMPGVDVLDELTPFYISVKVESEWPGTRLFDQTATVYRCRLLDGSVSVLQKSAESLFSWLQPSLPEDLSFLRSDHSPWLVTISHEYDAYFELSPNEVARLHQYVPELLLHPEATEQF